MRRRTVVLLVGTLIGIVVLAGRLLYVQTAWGPFLSERAAGQQSYKVPVQARRGDILDRNGVVLATDRELDTIWANPNEIRQPQTTAQSLAPILGVNPEWLLQRLQRRSAFEWLKRKVDAATAAKVRALSLSGIYITRESERVYPERSLAAQVLGFSGIDNQGLYGVELSYDKYLRGRNGYILKEVDAKGRDANPRLEERFIPPVPGASLVLTIDARLQQIAERELAKGVLAANAKGGTAIIEDPKTGEILALANVPSFDPNQFAASGPDVWKNPAVSNTISPGSVFKPITAAAALQEGLITPQTGLYDSGAFKVPGHTISNWNGAGLGSTTFKEAFQESANTIFARVGVMVGLDRFYDYLKRFGFLSRSGIDLPGEAIGIFPPQNRATVLDLAVMAFGQTLTVTPLQMINAIAAVANGGELMWPHVAKQIRLPDQEVVDIHPRVLHRVLSPQTARTLAQLMENVVAKGTGKRAQVPGYRLAGKTGTTQVVENSRIVAGKYLASFMGFGPVADPRLVVYVMIQEPQGIYYGGYRAAPVVGAIFQDAFHVLGIVPTEPVTPLPRFGAPQPEGDQEAVPVPNLINLDPVQAGLTAQVKGLGFVAKGPGWQITRQIPEPGALVPVGTVVVGLTGDATWAEEGVRVTLPDLTGLPFDQVAKLLGERGLKLAAEGTGKAVAQDPAPGSDVPVGGTVRVRFEPDLRVDQPILKVRS